MGAAEWNRWRGTTRFAEVDLSGADLSGMKLNEYSFLRANLRGASLTRAQLEHTHLKDADMTGAILTNANLEGANARDANFDDVVVEDANFEVTTLRGARFRNARLARSRFHRAYLRDTDLSGANLAGAWLRFAILGGACCARATFAGADLQYSSMVKTDLRGADLVDARVFGISAWNIQTDEHTRQDLIVGRDNEIGEASLRVHDLQTAQLLALMLDGAGVRRVLDTVTSKLVLILGSFSPEEKPALDALRTALQGEDYVAVTFDFQRPADRDYAETIITLAGMSRFVVADFTNAKEVRAEVAQIRSQYRRVPVVPIARAGTTLPITMANVFTPADLKGLVRYAGLDDLLSRVRPSIIDPAEAAVSRIAAAIGESEAILRGE
jgi:uncharacterized protein YjbI with pentapeptide repeats